MEVARSRVAASEPFIAGFASIGPRTLTEAGFTNTSTKKAVVS
ncbi:hypothetical protein BH09ACT4_BH09ACT4_14240 [soil metagenome]